MTIDDDDLPPPRRPARPASALWWMLIAAAVIVAMVLMWPREPRTSPAERNTTPVSRAPVLLPAKP